MSLLSLALAELMDGAKKVCIEIVHRRAKAMVEGLGIEVSPNPLFDGSAVDRLRVLGAQEHREEAVQYLKNKVHSPGVRSIARSYPDAFEASKRAPRT
jgi:aspartate 4-decarboxylase